MHQELKTIRSAAIMPALFVALLWLVHGSQAVLSVNWSSWGLYPRSLHGLLGVVTSPLLHADWMHLFNNSVSLFFLATLLVYFYRSIAAEVFFWMWLMSGVWIWIFARPSYHIGASMLVYGLAFFLFSSGFIRRNYHLMSLSLLVVVVYGSLVWGLLPILEHISWEGHMAGALAGLLCAFYYRQYGTVVEAQSQVSFDDDPDDSNPYWLIQDEAPPHTTHETKPPEKIVYHYIPSDKKEQ
jgi:membrane associated rhomboid family serine protease